MKNIKIKDVNLVTNVTGNEKIPVSNGSGKPAAVTISQILEKVPSADLSEYATNDTVDLKIADALDNSDVIELLDSKADKSEIYSKKLINVILNASKFEFVDLGLPSGLKWATCNIGAEKPEDYGLYFAWGELEGYTGITDEKQFTWEDYKWCNGTYNTLTKYNTSSDKGIVDNLCLLELADDAVYNLDNSCRMPTNSEIKELMNNTTFTWETSNGVIGARFTGVNGNSIFVPAAGSLSSVSGEGTLPNYNAYICSSTTQGNYTPRYPARVFALLLQSRGVVFSYLDRDVGNPIRAVQDANSFILFNPKETISKLSDLENQLSNVYTKSEVDAKILELQTLINNYINGTSQVSELDT